MTKTEQNRVLVWRLKVLREAGAACIEIAERISATFPSPSKRHLTDGDNFHCERDDSGDREGYRASLFCARLLVAIVLRGDGCYPCRSHPARP